MAEMPTTKARAIPAAEHTTLLFSTTPLTNTADSKDSDTSSTPSSTTAFDNNTTNNGNGNGNGNEPTVTDAFR